MYRCNRHFRPFLVLVSAAVCGVITSDLSGQCELAKLLPNDGAGNDKFGWSVAISGEIAIVGAHGDNDNGGDSGSAYLFDTTTGRQIAKLLPEDGGAQHDNFGNAVAILGATALVGAFRDDDNGTDSGSVYLFDISDPNNPVQIAKLLPNDGAAEDFFGVSVAISAATAIVGARQDDDNGSNSGSAYLFDISDPANPTQIAKLLPDDGAGNDEFGVSVGISGAIAVVGAHYDDDNGGLSGSAYLFDTTAGKQIFKLLPNDGAAQDYFGRSVGISGATAIVGAWADDDNGSYTGSAYLFDTNTGQQIAKLLANDGQTDDYFGRSVAISGATAVVGASKDDDTASRSGSAYLFDTTTGRQIAKLLASDGAFDDQLGWSVAISGATAIVGTWGDDDNGPFSGSAYLFDSSRDFPDCNGNTISDDCEVALGLVFDCNENGIPDQCDIADNPRLDADGTGILDECEEMGDLNGDGSVGASDLLTLLSSWGLCDDCDVCPTDLDDNCTVGAGDLMILLSNWG